MFVPWYIQYYIKNSILFTVFYSFHKLYIESEFMKVRKNKFLDTKIGENHFPETNIEKCVQLVEVEIVLKSFE